MSKENEISNKIINLELIYLIKASNIHVKQLCNKIKFYELKIQKLNHQKPYKFQKKKIKEYNEKLEEYNNKIMELYNKLEEEFDLITGLNQKNFE